MSNGQILKSPHAKLGRKVDRVCYTTAHIKSPPKVKGFVFCMSKQNALDTQKKIFKHVHLRKLQTMTLLHA